jgi:Rieske Fe-S protein
MCDEGCTRRKFLASAAALAAGGALTSLVGCGSPSANHLLEGGQAEPIALSLADYPALQQVGGAITMTAGAHGGRMVVYRRSETEVVAVSSVCPHQGCIVNYTGSTGETPFVCPCHGSAFGAEGELRRGPATRGLTRYAATLSGDRVVISI